MAARVRHSAVDQLGMLLKSVTWKQQSRELRVGRIDGVRTMPDATRLRDIAARMLAVAVDAKDQKVQELLSKRAGECLDQAAVLEAAGCP